MLRLICSVLVAGFVSCLMSLEAKAGPWDGAWIGQSKGRSVELRISGDTLHCWIGERPWVCHEVQVTPDMVSFRSGTTGGAAVTMRRSGNTAVATIQGDPAVSTVTFARAAAKPQASAASWDGTWSGLADLVGNNKGPFEITISGGKAVQYLYGGARRAINIQSSTATADKFVMDITNQANRTVVTLHRTGPHAALYEYTAPGGVRITGNALRR